MTLLDFRKDYDPYFQVYLDLINPQEKMFDLLETNKTLVVDFFKGIPEKKYKYRYANDKWSIYQILQHITDTERIFCYRALRIIREDQPQITPYDHNAYANSYLSEDKETLIEEYTTCRKLTILFYKSLLGKQLKDFTVYNSYKLYASLIPFICCGHELHHINILKERYL